MKQFNYFWRVPRHGQYFGYLWTDGRFVRHIAFGLN